MEETFLMCNHITFLARSNDWRYVAQCEHGTIHLNWDRKTLHIQLKDYLRLVRFIEKASQEYEGEVNDGYNYLRQNNTGYFELWLFGMGLLLGPRDFQILVSIVREAAGQLQNRAESRPEQLQKKQRVPSQLKRLSGPEFSLN